MKTRKKHKLNINPFMVRAFFVRRGSTLAMWAKDRGYPADTVYRAVRNERHGKRSQQIIRELKRKIKK